jgi:Phosphotransferase enzyme family
MHGLLPTIVRKQLSRIFWPARDQASQACLVEGLPPGVPLEPLEALCRQHLGDGYRHAAHRHLSSWKPRGTYRLELTAEAGARWRVIFKDESCSIAAIPALRALPITPGPPEFAVYQGQQPALARFLPDLYWSREVERGVHFQYFIEDLGGAFERLTTDAPDLTLAVNLLLQLQAALRETFNHGGHRYLAVYDRQYSEDLLDYARRSLEACRAGRPGSAIDDLCRSWQRVVDVHQREEFYQHRLAVPIHGDYRRSNLHVRTRDRKQVKVVGWEWAGIGVPHADLASLLQGVDPAAERAALELFARAHGELDAEEHLRLFRWCQLERRLLDAGFLARQQIAAGQLPGVDHLVADAAQDVLRSTELLAAAPRRLAVA